MRARSLASIAVLSLWMTGGAAASPPGVGALPAPPPGASAEGARDEGTPRVRARLLVDAPDASGTWRAGVLFEMDPGWHLYWRHPGETGLATRVDLDLDGEVGPLAWPAPEAFREDGLVTYGYADAVLIAAPLVPAHPGVTLRASAELLACEAQCLPASFELERPLAAEPDPRAREAVHTLFERSAARVPVSAAQRGIAVDARWTRVPRAEGEPLDAELRISGCGAAGPCRIGGATDAVPFYVYEPAPWLVHATLRPAADGSLVVALTGQGLPDSPRDPGSLRGVLALRGADGAVQPVELALPLPREDAQAAAPPAAASAASVTSAALLRALLFGFLGGLVLNLMPCVLPVLALKLYALAELSRKSRREVAQHAAAYAGGIQVTLAALAGVVLLLRASGRAVGWGFQLQEPLFVAAIATLLVTFAANLFGAFELEFAPDRLTRVGAASSGAARSFFDGLLAVVLATPCSAPFLGTAVGFAFASAAPVGLAIFAAIGAGLAAPFVAVSLSPGLARRVPRGGTWMLELRRALAFALLATVVWLLWIAGRQGGADAAMGLLALLLCVAVACWLYGMAQRARGRLGVGVLVASVIAIVLVGQGRIELSPRAEAAPGAAEQPFDRAALESALAAGRPAFVYFSADWCITCKLNERRVIDTPAAREELARLGFAVFHADWTRRDAAIAAELARLGRAGVPAYALFTPDAPEYPRLLPDLLTQDAFHAALRDAASASAPRAQAAAALP
jgi:thiol:disulfide interchange protein DsbD